MWNFINYGGWIFILGLIFAIANILLFANKRDKKERRRIADFAFGAAFLFVIVLGLRIYISTAMYHWIHNTFIFVWLLILTVGLVANIIRR